MISVIIPVYNTGREYLCKCIDSILNQTYKDFEILIVDDGSGEETCKNIESISEKDARIFVHTKPNGGVSSARNYGLKHAHGEYVVFVDGDDVLEPDYFERAISLIGECDLVVGKVNWYNSVGIQKSNYDGNSPDDVSKYYFPKDKEEVVRKFMNWPVGHAEFLSGFQPEVWCKLYKKELLEGLEFDQKLPIGEDVLFFLEYLLRCKSIVVVNRVFYGYRLNNESAMWKTDRRHIDKYKKFIETTIDIYNKNGLANDLPLKIYYEIKELASCFFRRGHENHECYKNAVEAVEEVYHDRKIKELLRGINSTGNVPFYSAFMLKHGINGIHYELLKRRLVSFVKR